MTATVGGILLALGGRIPISPYVTTLSFLIYVLCRVIGGIRANRGLNGRVMRRSAVPAV
jgi:zinc/manganese transport system permease protein